MHLREERHRSRARLWAMPRSEKPIVQPRELGTGRSVDLQPDTHGCPGKHGRQLQVRCGDNTRGGQPHRTFILGGREPIPRCCNRHPIHRWRTEWNAGRPVGRTSEITREPDGMFAAWGVRGPWGCTRRRGSYSNPRISQSVSRRSSARAREISMGGGRGCQSFHKGKARSQRNHAHDNDRVRHPQTENDRNQKDTDETASWKRRDRPWFALLEFALSVEVPRGITDERYSADRTVTPTGTKQKWAALWRSALFSSTRLRSKNLMSGCTCHPFIPVCTGSGLGMQNPLANFIGVFSLVRDVRGFQVNPLCRHDITRSDRQIGNHG